MLEAFPERRAEVRRRARVIVETLRSLQVTSGEGLRWNAENPEVFTPDLWVGFLGPATALARWAAGQHSALLSPDWTQELLKGNV
jgi:hypothetical protein